MDGCLPMAVMMLEYMSLLENKLSDKLLHSTISLSQESLPIHQNTKSPAWPELCRARVSNITSKPNTYAKEETGT